MQTEQSSDFIVNIKAASITVAGRPLIHDFSLQLQAGERVGLTGPSGCGKTTLLRSIVDRKLPASATAQHFAITSCRIGYAPQRGGMLPWYSLRRNLHVFAEAASGNSSDWCETLLSTMELAHAGSTFPEQLSGGELQRARLACALATQPALYCADEPLTEVGLRQKWRLMKRLSFELQRLQTSLLLVSHDLDTLVYLCDRVLVLDGAPGQSAQVTSQFDLPTEVHPRLPEILSSTPFHSIREEMREALYFGKAGTNPASAGDTAFKSKATDSESRGQGFVEDKERQ